MIRAFITTLLVTLSVSLAGCQEYGDVEQGRVVGFDAEKQVVTIIKDAGINDQLPVYTVLPAHDFALPKDSAETGALPAVGLRLKLDLENKVVVMYNPETKKFDSLPIEIVSKHEGVDIRQKHPLVYDETTKKNRVFPAVNEIDKTVTIYSRRQLLLCTVKIADADFARYKVSDWDAGDEVRIYYREPGKALRFMNVTKTDISKGK